MNGGQSSKSSAFFPSYASRLSQLLKDLDWVPVTKLAEEMKACRQSGRQVFLAGNGGSAANSLHLANDFLCGLSSSSAPGMRVHALPANQSVITCLANDKGYETIFSLQLAVQARHDDVLIVLSGSGNSPNIILALEEAKRIGMRTFAILGYSGGRAKQLADTVIHAAIDDMQIAEDTQLIIGHMILQWLFGQQNGVDE